MIEIEDLHVSYGQSEVIHGLNFKAEKNETLAIMGRNGMGKTTLFKSLMGILPSNATKAEVDGESVQGDESYMRVNKGLAYVPQGRMIFPNMTVQENIETGLGNAESRNIPEDIYALFPVLFDMRKRKGKMREITIIVSEQVLSFTMEVADRIIVIDKGKFIHEDLREDVDAEKIKGYLSV